MLVLVWLCAATPAAVVAREGDSVSEQAVDILEHTEGGEFRFWLPSFSGSAAHLVPYYRGPEAEKAGQDFLTLVNDSKNKPLPEALLAYRDAVSLALHLPPSDPVSRSLRIVDAERELVRRLLSSGREKEARPFLDDLFMRAPESPLADKGISPVWLAAQRAKGRGELSVFVEGASDFTLSVDGQDFSPPKDAKLSFGFHEVVVRLAGSPGLIHHIELTQKSQRLSLSADVERALVDSPSGFYLRRGQGLSAKVARQIADETRAESVWLIETGSEQPPALRVTAARATITRSVVVLLSPGETLHPIDVAERDALGRVIVAAGRSALSGSQPAGYDLSRSGGELLLTKQRSEPLYKKWWLWTAVSAAAAAGALAAVLVATRDTGVTMSPVVIHAP